MTENHLIVPSPEQVDQWFKDAVQLKITPKYYIATQAAQWSADQELEACCEWMRNAPFGLSLNTSSHQLRAARRPKPPSLKEQALSLLDKFSDPEGLYLDVKSHNTIRRALEALDD